MLTSRLVLTAYLRNSRRIPSLCVCEEAMTFEIGFRRTSPPDDIENVKEAYTSIRFK